MCKILCTLNNGTPQGQILRLQVLDNMSKYGGGSFDTIQCNFAGQPPCPYYHTATPRLPAFDQFIQACMEVADATPACADWHLNFAEEDFQREWIVTATAPKIRNGVRTEVQAAVKVASAMATPSTPSAVIAWLVKTISEM
jgi:hypothetical protein